MVRGEDLLDQVQGQVGARGDVTEAAPVAHHTADQAGGQSWVLGKAVQHLRQVDRRRGVISHRSPLPETVEPQQSCMFIADATAPVWEASPGAGGRVASALVV